MDKINVGIIGLGGIAQLVHLPILSRLNGVSIKAVAELNKNRLDSVSERFGIKDGRYRNYQEMLAKEELDTVIIASPTNTHKVIALDCLKAKKNILIEKPITRTYDEAKEISDLAAKLKLNAMVGMNFRFRPDSLLLKSFINSGEIGDVLYMQCSWLRKKSSEQSWITNRSAAGGGVIVDLGIVLLDLAIWLLDFPAVTTVSAESYNINFKSVEDSSVGFIRTKNSEVINFEVSWSLHSEKDSFNLIVYGTKGTVMLNPFRAYRRTENEKIDYTPAHSSHTKDLYRKSYENELKHFIGAIKGLNPFISTDDEAANGMRVIEGVYKSANQHSEVKL